MNILCLSNGGSKIRETELRDAADIMKIENVQVIDREGLKDGNWEWNAEEIEREVGEYLKQWEINSVSSILQ